MTNPRFTVLYTGVTNNLERRLHEHRVGATLGFTRRYNVRHLVYYESTTDIRAALEREKQIKGWTRAKKLGLIEQLNPDWRDLAANWASPPPDPSLRSG
ncbi:MAG: GIY-YIG nuclease family protein [Chloroflexi bacterium]|nr:GIY-YIG nuclease family protein [Chloroflexota bacterium]